MGVAVGIGLAVLVRDEYEIAVADMLVRAKQTLKLIGLALTLILYPRGNTWLYLSTTWNLCPGH